MAHRFRLTSLLSDSDRNDQALKGYYKSWKELNQKSKSSFTAIDNTFFTNKILRDLEPGPLKLYLFFSHVASNDYGHSWHSIQSIADYFGAQTRTIDNWIKGLIDKDLIYRAPKGSKSHHTYLIPFSDTLITHPSPKNRDEDSPELLEDLISKIRDLEFLYGEIIGVYHLFQWTSQKGKQVSRDASTQMLLIITKRKNDVLIGHIHTLRKSNHLSVSELDIEEQSIFTSPFLFNGQNVMGIALTPFPSLKTRASIKDTINLVKELSTIEEWVLQDRQHLNYGIKDEILPVIDEENDENVDDEEKENVEDVDEDE
ncbi:hypothetical protein DZB84_20605 [Bacillus sp. HNG]|uniref:hypothetical protein n=1 Tax=Bacillus sp. HNG TaxID=2293325 RepID=UPI000E2EB1C2|nr:hypothetical protein [Bacillus sp. HNG]RFB11470.1 hypothetical protein DZB84_20605 [Bacillus sp. HNG]